MTNLYGSICLSDIPEELITRAQNGKKYLNIEVNQMQKPSQYGATHAVKMSVKKADRKEGVNYYIGNLKPSKFGNDNAAQVAVTAAPPANNASFDIPAVPANDNSVPF